MELELSLEEDEARRLAIAFESTFESAFESAFAGYFTRVLNAALEKPGPGVIVAAAFFFTPADVRFSFASTFFWASRRRCMHEAPPSRTQCKYLIFARAVILKSSTMGTRSPFMSTGLERTVVGVKIWITRSMIARIILVCVEKVSEDKRLPGNCELVNLT